MKQQTENANLYWKQEKSVQTSLLLFIVRNAALTQICFCEDKMTGKSSFMS